MMKIKLLLNTPHHVAAQHITVPESRLPAAKKSEKKLLISEKLKDDN